MKVEWKEFNELTSGELIEAYKKQQPIYRQTTFDEVELTQFEETKGFVYGWGSAYGDANDRILLMIENPGMFTLNKPFNQGEKGQ